MIITSLDNPKIKYLAKLNQAKNRKALGEFIVEGKHLVKEAKSQNVLIEAYSTEEMDGYITVTSQIMKKITNTDSLVTEIGLCKMLSKNELSNKILLLDGIQDPGHRSGESCFTSTHFP